MALTRSTENSLCSFQNYVKTKADALFVHFKGLEKLIQVVEAKQNEQVKDNASRRKTESEIEVLKQEEEKLLKCLAEVNAQITEKEEEAEILERKESANFKIVSLYRQHFAFRMKRSESDQISFIFTQIDKEHPDHCCFFDIMLEGSVYKVTKCVPEVKDINVLVSELNETNDLGAFVINMRKKFCSLV